MKRLGQMTKDELIEMVEKLQREEQQLEKENKVHQLAVVQQRLLMARSYLIDPNTIQLDQTYDVEGDKRLFHVTNMNGVMAWGYWLDSEELCAIPIARLKKISDQRVD